MMIKQKAREILYKSVLSVQWHEDQDGIRIRALVCNRKHNNLLIEQQFTDYFSLKDLVEEVGVKLPVSLSITGKGVLEKTVEHPSASWQQLLHSRLPGADPEAFTGQITQDPSILNVIRKDKLHQILAEFSKHGLSVVACYLGTTVLENLLPILGRQSSLEAPPYYMSFQGGKFEELQRVSLDAPVQTMEFNDQNITSHRLICFATGIAQMIDYAPISFKAEVPPSRLSYELNQYSTWLGLAGLSIIFLSLLINFLVYSQTSRSLSQVEGELYYSEGLIAKLDSLSSQIDQRQLALGDQVVRESKLSLLGDQVAMSIPAGIRLREFNLFPVEKSSPSDRSGQINYQQETILIRGETTENNLINEWIGKLENMEWVEVVQLMPYRAGQASVVSFELQLKLKAN
ncbi:MAG: hypothetical protein AAFO03_16075 [Bacteroidota bacterium]